MAYKLVIFDFDGTLADSSAWMTEVLPQVAQRFHFRSPSQTELEALRHRDNRAILRDLGIGLWKLPLMAVYMRRLVAQHADRIPLYAGVTELLTDLHSRGVLIAIVSSNSERNVRSILGQEAAARVHHYACGAGLFGKRSKFRAVLKRTRLSGQQALAVGDEVRDIEAAKAEGIDTGAVTWGYAASDLLQAHAPTRVFTTIDELRRAVAA